MDDKRLKYWGAGIAVVFVALAGTYSLGFQAGVEQTKKIVIKNVIDPGAPEEVTADFSVFWEAWRTLKDNHIRGNEIPEQDLLYGAIEGLAGALDDPNTVFFRPDDFERFDQDIQGNFGGIGAEIGMRNGQLTIISPLKNSPAERVGLQPGDSILEIDGKSTIGLTLGEAVKQIRGELGTTLTLGLFRASTDSEFETQIVRENIKIPAVGWEFIDGNIVHLQVFTFSANTPLAFQGAIIESVLNGGDGIVLDLRNNPGGLLDVAVQLAGWFMERGDIVVTERFTSGEEIVLRAMGNESLVKFPVVVLVNGGSASASEILAGALRVNRNTKLVGEKTFGKGTVQDLETLSDGSTLKITIANWLLPNGDLIEGNGLDPNIEVELTPEQIEAGEDPQLDRAIELLKEELGS